MEIVLKCFDIVYGEGNPFNLYIRLINRTSMLNREAIVTANTSKNIDVAMRFVL